MNFLIRLFITAVVAFALANVLPGIHIDSLWTAIVVAFVLAILNVIVKPILILLTLPLTLITLGLFLFVINAIIILLAGSFVDGFVVDGFFSALLFSLLLSLINSILFKVQKERD